MKQFLKDYGLDIVVIILLIIFIGMLIHSVPDRISADEGIETSVREEKSTEEETTVEIKIEAETETKIDIIVEETQPPKPQYYIEWLDREISKGEFELLCRLTFCEAGNQDLETQTMVCLTVLNRLNNPDVFSSGIHGVVYQRLSGVPMYSVIEWSDFETREWTEQVEMAVRNAMACNNHPSDMYYFRTKHYHTFGQPYMVSGALWFSTQN